MVNEFKEELVHEGERERERERESEREMSKVIKKGRDIFVLHHAQQFVHKIYL